MNLVLVPIFVLIAAIAAGFAAMPLLRGARGKNNAVLAAAVAVIIAGIGLTTYFAVGRPELASRALSGLDANDFRALMATLSRRMHERPDDAQGWALLGRGYLALNAPDEAAKALARAIQLGEKTGAVPASLYSAYGEALVESAGGITPEAEKAFQTALQQDAHEPGARYYLGLAARARGQKDEALKYWEGLLADAPANAPWRPALVDQVAALKAEQVEQGKIASPDIAAMVQGLAQRLEKNPDDLEGWMRLVRAYAVLGEPDKAKSALARARSQFARDATAQESLAALARDLNLEK